MRPRKRERTATGYMEGKRGSKTASGMKTAALLTAALSACILTSCSFFPGHENLDAAVESVKNGEYENALTILENAEEKGENPENVKRVEGIANMELARYDEAARCFLDSLSANKGYVKEQDKDTSYYLAVAQYRTGDFEEAKKTYSAIIGLYPTESDAFLQRGKTELKLGETDNAIADFNRSIKLSPNDPDLYIDIYECLSASGMKEEGSKYLKDAMEISTKLTNLQKGKLYYCLGEYEQAKSSLESARNVSTEGSVTLYLGRTYEALGDTNYAASLYRAYLEANPSDVEIFNQLGLCCLDMGDYQGALEAFEAGLSVPDNEYGQTLKYNRIVAYENLGQFDQAALLMNDYLKEYPADEAAKREEGFLRTR